VARGRRVRRPAGAVSTIGSSDMTDRPGKTIDRSGILERRATLAGEGQAEVGTRAWFEDTRTGVSDRVLAGAAVVDLHRRPGAVTRGCSMSAVDPGFWVRFFGSRGSPNISACDNDAGRRRLHRQLREIVRPEGPAVEIGNDGALPYLLTAALR